MDKKIFIIVFVLVFIFLGVGFFVFSKNSESLTDPVEVIKQNSSTAAILPAAEPDYFPLRNFNVINPKISAKSAALYDTRSAKFLYEKEIHKLLPIASLTKLMTAVVILENLNLNKDIRISVEDLNVDGYGADLVKGETIRGSELLKMMLIESSNDAALVLDTEARAQGVNLVEKMNAKAEELGMYATKFTNTAGLDDNASSTAFDLIKLVEYVSMHRPLIWDILKIKSIDITSSDGKIVHHVVNTDQLLGQMPDIIGGKTGFTPVAMGTMILVTDINNGHSSLVGIILASNDRFGEVRELIEWGRKAYKWK